jgi:hypothetical protein
MAFPVLQKLWHGLSEVFLPESLGTIKHLGSDSYRFLVNLIVAKNLHLAAE